MKRASALTLAGPLASLPGCPSAARLTTCNAGGDGVRVTTARTASRAEFVRVPPAVMNHSARDSPKAALADVTSRRRTTLLAAGRGVVQPTPVMAEVISTAPRKNRAFQPGGAVLARQE